MSEKAKKKTIFFEELLEPESPLLMREGSPLETPVFVRRSKLYPGHISLIARHRMMRELPKEGAGQAAEEAIDLDRCRFCHPETLCAEASEERTPIKAGGLEYILAQNPFYYLPGHAVLFPTGAAPHSLKEAKQKDWQGLLQAGVKAAERHPDFRLGFNAGSYLCCGGSQRHLHLQMVPMTFRAPSEETLKSSLPDGLSYAQLEQAFEEKSLIIETAKGGKAFLAACWAPKFNLESIAVFSRPKRFSEMNADETRVLARWIHETAQQFVVPAGGGLNGYGLEVPGLPFMVRLIPRLPGAVQAFMEAGAGCMVISALPESIPQWWHA